MNDVPNSTKVLLGIVIALFVMLMVTWLGNRSGVVDTVSKKDLVAIGVKDPDKVLKEYKKKLKQDETEANNYLDRQIYASRENLTKEEKAIFGDNILEKSIVTSKYTETRLFIFYDKTDKNSSEDLEKIKEYLNNENKFDTYIVYKTNRYSLLQGKFVYVELLLNKGGTQDKDSTEVTNYDAYPLPKAFLVVDGELANEYKDLSELELK